MTSTVVKKLSVVMGALIISACRASSSRAPAPAQPPAIHLAQCIGPATSLPDSLLRALPPRTGRMRPDDSWADLAKTVPGGFAGAFYDSAHTPILMLTQPANAAAAKKALSGHLYFPVDRATVREARWDFGQLVDWFNYLLPRLDVPVMADKDESINRIRFGVTTVEQRDRVVRVLSGLSLPCDLVIVDLNGVTVRY